MTITLAAFAAATILAVITVSRLDRRPRTDDAFLQAALVHMAPEVSGRIVRLDVSDNSAVQRGDVLFVIDPEPYRLRVDQAAAQVDELAAELAVNIGKVASEGSKAQAASTEVTTARSQLALASVTRNRLEPLGAQGYVSREQVDEARTSERSARLSVQQAEQQAQASRESITSTKPLEEQLKAARASLALAERDLRLTTVRAPCAGRIAALNTAAGEYAVEGKPLFTIIDTESWHAVGDFRETDLAGIAIGQSATVYVLSDPAAALRGVVDGLGFGVAPDEAESSGGQPGLPHVARSLNWVRIAQRFPVRVRLDRPPPALMRVAASAVVIIDR